MKKVIKRDGRVVDFDESRIINAIKQAAKAAGENVSEEFCLDVAKKIKEYSKMPLTVDEIQVLVEDALMGSDYKNTARKYIAYRNQRDIERQKNSRLVKTFNEIVEVEDTNVKNENANINGNTPAGQMMKFASEATKEYAMNYLLSPEQAEAHKSGWIHIHDLDFYPSRTLTCCQIDLKELYDGGFRTVDAGVREPQNIRSYAALAAIVLQSNQNEMHGGQAFPAFDFFMADGVRKSFRKNFEKFHQLLYGDCESFEQVEVNCGEIKMGNDILKSRFPRVYEAAYEETRKETYQAMEAFIHNMCTMHQQAA